MNLSGDNIQTYLENTLTLDEVKILDGQEYHLLNAQGQSLVGERYNANRYSELERISKLAFTRKHKLVQTELSNLSRQKITGCLSNAMCNQLIDLYENDRNRLADATIAREIMENVLKNPRIDEALISYFKSEYMVLEYSFHKNTNTDESASYKWHCDAGPDRFSRIIIYLNATDEHQAKTLLSDRKTTDQLKSWAIFFAM